MKHHALKEDDPHRLVCPAGHSNWKPINGHFWCPSCDKHWDRDGDFELVRDGKTGERLDRTAVRALEEELAERRSVA